MLIKLFVSTTVLAVTLVGGCGSERRADQGCPDEEVLAASGACCDPALALVVDGISDCADSVVRPDAGTPDASMPDASDGGFTFPCPKDQLVDWRGECIKVSSQADGGMDGGVNDAGECVPVVVERCPPPQVRDPETGLCTSEGNPDGGTECPHFACPAGQVLREGRCADLVEACRFTCNQGQLLTDTCDCVDPTVPPVCPGPCPDGQARNNAHTCVTIGNTWTFPCNAGAGEVLKSDGSCTVPPIPWSFPCPVGKQLLADGTTCVDPPKTCVGALLNTSTQQCVVPPVCPGPCPDGQGRNNTGTCVVLNEAYVFPCAPGESVTEGGVCLQSWTFPCLPPKQLASNGSCQDPAPGPSLEVSYLAPPPLVGTTTALASQTGVNFGTLEVRNVANLQLAELPDVALTVLVADNLSDSYGAGVSGSVRADQRMDGCRLRDWPPLSGTFGPVRPDADGRVLFSGVMLRTQIVRRFTIECDLADLLPVGSTDSYAVDIAPGMQAVIVNGTVRTPMDLVVVSQNGSNPLAKVSVSCGHRITSDTGTVSTVRARPTFALASDSPGGTVTRGYIPIARYTVTASACEGLSLTRVKVKISYSDNSNTGWGNRAYQNSLAHLALSTNENQAWGTMAFADKTAGTFTLSTDATTVPLLVPAGQSRSFSVLMNVSEASTNTHDTVRIFPQDPVGWYGQDNPAGYPALSKAQDFVLSPSVPVRF